MDLYRRRRTRNAVVLTLSFFATALGLFWLCAILWTLLSNGLSAISLDLFTQNTPPPGSKGGLLNAIYGSVLMTAIATAIGTPIGILAGTFLAEYSRGSRIAPVIRFINDILLSAPSIIVGLFVYEVVVLRMGHFSAWAGAMAPLSQVSAACAVNARKLKLTVTISAVSQFFPHFPHMPVIPQDYSQHLFYNT